MNITGMNPKEMALKEYTAKTPSNPLSLGSEGDVIEGVIRKVSDKISIDFNGTEITVSQSAVHNATEGEIRKYKITDVSENGIALKEMGSSINNNSATGVQSTMLGTDSIILLEQNFAAQKSGQQKDAEGVGRATAQDCEELEEEGMSLEKYELERLERALTRIKEQRTFKEESLVNYQGKQKEKRECIEKIAIHNQLPDGVPESIVDEFQSSGIPVTQENVERVAGTLGLAGKVTELSDSSKAYMIKNELAPTVKNLYQAKYSGSDARTKAQSVRNYGDYATQPPTQEEWKAVEEQAAAVVENSGCEVNADTMDRAKWLFMNQLPISSETLDQQDALVQIQQKSDEKSILNSIIRGMVEGLEPEAASLDDRIQRKAVQVVEEFSRIQDQAVEMVCEEQKEVTLSNLKQAQDSLMNAKETTKTLDSSTDITIITAKRQLEEIRLQMSVEAARGLLGKGIQLDTTNLEKIVEELKGREKDYYQNLLQESGTSATLEQASLLQETTQKVQELQRAPSYILGATIQDSASLTLEELHSQASDLSSKLQKAGTAYETLMTAPRRDLGDNIHKAFQNVDDILTDLGLDLIEANQRAVRILGYNSKEITAESVQNMKAYDTQVNTLLNNLDPAITVELIRNNTNPLTIPMDELNDMVSDMKEELGVSEEERYSKYLWKLDKENGISEAERESYIGIYRLLNQVQKSDGAAVGAVVGAGQELTLKNLLTAVRTSKTARVNQEIDDDFGTLEQVRTKNKSITAQVDTAFTDAYQTNVVSNILEEVTPAKLREVANAYNTDLLNMSPEQLKDALLQVDGNQEVDQEYYQAMVKEIRQVTSQSREAMQFLKAYEIPETLNHLTAIKHVMSEGQTVVKQLMQQKNSLTEQEQEGLEQAVEGLMEALEDDTTMQEQNTKVEEAVRNILTRQYSDTVITSEQMGQLRRLEGGLQMHAYLSKKESYEIPLVTEEGITNVNLTIVRNVDQKGRVHIKMDSPTMGAVEADFTVKGEKVSGLILCESAKVVADIDKEKIKQSLIEEGFEVSAIHTGIHSVSPGAYIREIQENPEDVDTKDLYRLAKSFIRSLQTTESTYYNNTEGKEERNR